MERLTDLNPDGYVEISYDHEEELYRLPNGEEARFAKMVTVRNGDDVSTHKLSYTRSWMGQKTSRPLPIIRMKCIDDGIDYGEEVKVRLDGQCEDYSQMTGFELSLDSVGPVPRG